MVFNRIFSPFFIVCCSGFMFGHLRTILFCRFLWGLWAALGFLLEFGVSLLWPVIFPRCPQLALLCLQNGIWPPVLCLPTSLPPAQFYLLLFPPFQIWGFHCCWCVIIMYGCIFVLLLTSVFFRVCSVWVFLLQNPIKITWMLNYFSRPKKKKGAHIMLHLISVS